MRPRFFFCSARVVAWGVGTRHLLSWFLLPAVVVHRGFITGEAWACALPAHPAERPIQQATPRLRRYMCIYTSSSMRRAMQRVFIHRWIDTCVIVFASSLTCWQRVLFMPSLDPSTALRSRQVATHEISPSRRIRGEEKLEPEPEDDPYKDISERYTYRSTNSSPGYIWGIIFFLIVFTKD